MQQFLDKHSRSCWRRPTRCALFLRRAMPTPSDFSRADVAFVGVPLPAAPYFFVGSRQRVPTFPGRTSPLFAPPSPLRLIPPSGHANAFPLFPGGRRLCWRRPTRCALSLRLATPTPSGRHANTIRIFPGGRRLCWRRPTLYALFLRRATPTPSNFSRADVAFVGAALPAAPYFFASPRQHRPEISWHVGVLGCSEIKKTIPASNAGFLTTGQSPCSSRYAYNA